jgi:hypothetical protein
VIETPHARTQSSPAIGAGSRKRDKGFDERLDVRMVANNARIDEWVVLVQFDSSDVKAGFQHHDEVGSFWHRCWSE